MTTPPDDSSSEPVPEASTGVVATDGGEDDSRVSRLFSTGHDEPLARFGDYESRSESILHTLVVLLGALLAASILVVVGADLLAWVGFTEESTPVIFDSLTLSLNFLGFLTASLLYLSWREEHTSLVRASIPSRRDVTIIAVGFISLVGLMVAFEVLVSLLGIETAENVSVQQGREHPELFLALLPIQFLLTAPAEELLFRGVVQGLFRRAYGIIPGIVLAALLFAGFHLPALGGGEGVLPVLAVLFLSGAFLGLLYEITGNLTVPIVVHAFWNVLVFSSEYLQAVEALAIAL